MASIRSTPSSVISSPARRRGRVGVRLDVFLDDLDLVRLVAEHDAIGGQLVDGVEDERVGLAEAGEGAGERSGEPDLDGAVAAATAELGGVGADPTRPVSC